MRRPAYPDRYSILYLKADSVVHHEEWRSRAGWLQHKCCTSGVGACATCVGTNGSISKNDQPGERWRRFGSLPPMVATPHLPRVDQNAKKAGL